jgi:membrane protein implicated in regulation of membrane protease activity
MDMIAQIEPWHWFVLAAALFVLEVTATTGFLIGIATSALLLSIVTYLTPDIGWEWQMGLFGGLSVILTLAYKKYFKNFNEETDSPLMNDRAGQMVGTELVLEQEIDQSDALMISDTRWQVECEGTLAAGTRVSIVGTRGMTLLLQEAQ